MARNLFMGIDPGAGGGVAVLDETSQVVCVEKMPATERDIYELLGAYADAKRMKAVIEHVHSMPKQGVASSFKFGRSYGGLRMGLVAAEIPFEEIQPHVWQGALRCRSKGDKNVTKQRAQELFPAVKVTHAVADALLIAEYCRRAELGLLQTK